MDAATMIRLRDFAQRAALCFRCGGRATRSLPGPSGELAISCEYGHSVDLIIDPDSVTGDDLTGDERAWIEAYRAIAPRFSQALVESRGLDTELGTFWLVEHPGVEMINPRTGERVPGSPRTVLYYTPSAALVATLPEPRLDEAAHAKLLGVELPAAGRRAFDLAHGTPLVLEEMRTRGSSGIEGLGELKVDSVPGPKPSTTRCAYITFQPAFALLRAYDDPDA